MEYGTQNRAAVKGCRVMAKTSSVFAPLCHVSSHIKHKDLNRQGSQGKVCSEETLMGLAVAAVCRQNPRGHYSKYPICSGPNMPVP